MKHELIAIIAMAILASPMIGSAESTRVTVHVLANDAKLTGTGMGGVLVTVKDIESGEILSQGIHAGGTGDTDKIMREPRVRHEDRFTGDTDASYIAEIDIDKPTIVEISAKGPLAYPQAAQTASITTLLLPGKHIEGEGVVLSLHGFVVEIMTPESVESLNADETFILDASVRMMCGCPTQPGGLWDSDRYEIEALIIQNGELIKTAPMKFSGKTNIYTAELEAPSEGGGIELWVTASDRETANFGIDKATYRLAN